MKLSPVWQRLLWKDAIVIRPLLVAVLVGVLLMPVLIASAGNGNMHTSDALRVAFALWLLLPNLVAIGAPAFLIGNEEESGTLSWLQTLPVRWQTVAASKVMVAVVSVAVIWLLTSSILYLQTFRWATDLNLKLYPNADAVSVEGIAQLLFFSISLLLYGFISSYLFRSPVAALVALVPIITIVTVVSNSVGRWLLGVRYYGYSGEPSFTEWCRLISAAIFALAALWYAQRCLARRRMSAASTRIVNRVVAEDPMDAFRPPASISLSQPSVFGAMLWQQWRQVALLSLSMCAISLVFIGIYLNGLHNHPRHRNYELTLFVVSATYLSLGAITFYGDSVRRRCEFYADRGVSPGLLWISRLLPTLTLAIVMLIPVLFAEFSTKPAGTSHQHFVLTALLLYLYGVGQLVSLWSHRPILSFFAAPVIASLMMALIAISIGIYYSLAWTLAIMVPVLLLATWRLTPRWLVDGLGRAFHWRATGYLLLALTLPYVLILSARWITTPPVMAQWQNEMIAIDIPSLSLATRSSGRLHSDQVVADAFLDQKAMVKIDVIHTELIPRVHKELVEDKPVGYYASQLEIHSLLVESFGHQLMVWDTEAVLSNQRDWRSHRIFQRPSGILAIKTALSWSRRVRQLATEGAESLETLIEVAESMERKAIRGILYLKTSEGETATVIELVAMIPDAQLRKESRRIAVISDWQRQHDASGPEEKTFAGQEVAMAHGMWMVDSIEANRSQRKLDLTVRQLLQQIDSDDFFAQDRELYSWLDDWLEARYGADAINAQGSFDLLISWVTATRHENRIRCLLQR